MPLPRSSISEAERAVLKVLWEQGPGTVREIKQHLRQQQRRWAHTTVITLLGRLQSKGYVTSDKSGFAHVFRATVSREEVVRQQLENLADEFCEGQAGPLVLALVEGYRFSEKEIEAFRGLIDSLEARRRRRSGK